MTNLNPKKPVSEAQMILEAHLQEEFDELEADILKAELEINNKSDGKPAN
ncbi:MAG TPA: hypothetical protein VGO63_02880 [Candidatus Paceibacterota bacterium]|nr:hypothetical protein [Candidatus Paceibacterota bacterium]